MCPHNCLCEEIMKEGGQAITFAKLFGTLLENSDVNTNSSFNPSFDITPYDAIIFDEIYLTTMEDRIKLYNWFRFGTFVVNIYATGDESQLSNFLDERYSRHKINVSVEMLFPFKIMLKRCKRGVDEANCKRIDSFCSQFPHHSSVMAQQYCKNYFGVLNDARKLKKLFKTHQGIGNHDKNRIIQKLLNIDVFRVGHDAVVKSGSRFKVGKTVFNTNTSVRCLSVHENFVIVKHHSGEEIKLDKKRAETLFAIHESRTCQSIQGLTKDKIALMGWTNASATWLYTACTRARNCADVVLIDPAILPDDPLKQDWDKIRRNIARNLNEDLRHNRRVDEPVDRKWVEEKYRKCSTCALCNLQIGSINEISIDRIRGNLKFGHDKDNCQLVHLQCNTIKGFHD